MEHSELMADLREMNDKVAEGYKREYDKGGESTHADLVKMVCISQWKSGWIGELMIRWL